MWHFKTTTLPAVIGALGIVAKTAPNYVSQIPGAPSLTELQYIFTAITYLRFLGGTWYGSYKHFQKKAKHNNNNK